MNFFDYIRDWFIYATQVFVDLALESYSSWYIPDVMGDLFNYLSDFTSEVAGYLYDASDWYDEVVDKLSDILSWSTIWDYILDYVPNLIEIRDWFYDKANHILDLIDAWWGTVTSTVQDWIDVAVEAFQSQLDDLNSWVTTIQEFIDEIELDFPDVSAILSWFSNWWENILSELELWWNDKLLDIQDLIDSAFIARDDLWSGWQDWKAQVAEFFIDPWEWLYNRFDDFFERFW